MKRTFFLSFFAILFISRLVGAQTEIKKPNILFILTDDQRWDSLGCYGNQSIRTPNLDRMAAQGVLLNGFYTAAPLCCPSRAIFLTGKYPHQTGIYTNEGPFDFHGAQFLAEYLNHAGYLTGFIGKAHVGQYPEQWGFKQIPIVMLGSGEQLDPKVKINGKKQTLKGGPTQILTEKAIQFITDNRDKRWFLWFSTTAPHSPYRMFPNHPYKKEDIAAPPGWPPSEPFQNNRQWDTFYSTVSALDEQIGRILKTLDDLHLTDNTFIFFTSDNGYMKGSHGMAAKWIWFEESIRLPGVVKWPGRISPNRKLSTLFSNVDFVPTILEVAGIPKPKTLPGQSMIPALIGQKATSAPVFGELKGKGSVSPGLWQMVRTEQWKYVRSQKEGKWEEFLYNLTLDPYEKKNVFNLAENKEVLAEYRNRVESWLEQTPPVIPLVDKQTKSKNDEDED